MAELDKYKDPEAPRQQTVSGSWAGQADSAPINEASRLSGAAAVASAIKRLRQQAEQLDALLRQLPRELTPGADEALWEMAQRMGR